MLKVYISQGGFDVMMAGPQILIAEILPDGSKRVAKPITLVMEPMRPGVQIQPTIDFGDYELNEQFVQAMAELDATERHLEDLQRRT